MGATSVLAHLQIRELGKRPWVLNRAEAVPMWEAITESFGARQKYHSRAWSSPKC